MDNSFTPLSKKEAQYLEHNTTRIENLKNSMPYVNILRINNLQLSVLGWYHKYSLRPGYVKEHWKKLTELFGFKPVYYVTHVCRNALWAFKWREQKVLIYQDERGLAIQVEKEFRKDLVIPFFKYLKKVLYQRSKK